MDVAAWLKNLGLGQYEAAFCDNAIDGDVLPNLTAEDLNDAPNIGARVEAAAEPSAVLITSAVQR